MTNLSPSARALSMYKALLIICDVLCRFTFDSRNAFDHTIRVLLLLRGHTGYRSNVSGSAVRDFSQYKVCPGMLSPSHGQHELKN